MEDTPYIYSVNEKLRLELALGITFDQFGLCLGCSG